MRKKTFYAFLALILTAVIVIACGVGSSWFTNGDIKTWFNSWGQKTENTEQETALNCSLRTTTCTAAEGDEEVTEPAEEADVERQEVFKKTNVMTTEESSNSSKVQEWLSGKVQGEDYDGYTYLLKIDISCGDEYNYSFINEAADICLNLEVTPDYSTTPSLVTYRFSYLYLSTDKVRSIYTCKGSTNDKNDSRYLYIEMGSDKGFICAINEYGAHVSDSKESSAAWITSFSRVLFNQDWHFEYTGENPAPNIEETLTVYKNVEAELEPVTPEIELLLNFSGLIEKDMCFTYDDMRSSITTGMITSFDYTVRVVPANSNRNDYGFNFTYAEGAPFIFVSVLQSEGEIYYGVELEAGSIFVKESAFDPEPKFSYCELRLTDIAFSVVFVFADNSERVICSYSSDSNEYGRIMKIFQNGNCYFDQYSDIAEMRETANFYGIPYPVLPLPEDPEKEGYTFIGWYWDEAFTQPYDNEPIYEHTPLYAKFEINRYTVTFDTNGGYEIDDITVDWNTVLEPVTPTLRGYEFLGWFLEDGTEYTDQPITEDTILTAKWKVITFTVTFYVDGEVYATKEVEYGTRFIDVVEETSNLRVISVMTEDGEKDISTYLNTTITEDFGVVAEVKVSPFKAFIKDYPWAIPTAAGVVLFTIVGIVVSARKKK